MDKPRTIITHSFIPWLGVVKMKEGGWQSYNNYLFEHDLMARRPQRPWVDMFLLLCAGKEKNTRVIIIISFWTYESVFHTVIICRIQRHVLSSKVSLLLLLICFREFNETGKSMKFTWHDFGENTKTEMPKPRKQIPHYDIHFRVHLTKPVRTSLQIWGL